MPKELYKKWGQMGLLAFAQAPEIYKDLPADFPIPAGLKPDTIDNFHKMVARFEYARMGSSGVNSGIFSGINIALPPIMFFGSEAMKKRVIPDVVNGNNWICLAITEPTGGSDTANITTSAVLSDDGKHYIVNGTKKVGDGKLDGELGWSLISVARFFVPRRLSLISHFSVDHERLEWTRDGFSLALTDRYRPFPRPYDLPLSGVYAGTFFFPPFTGSNNRYSPRL